jgi:hypothetical protein
MLCIFIALKNQSSSARFEHGNLGSNGKHDNHYTSKTSNMVKSKEDGINGTCGAPKEDEILNGKDHLRESRGNGRIILKWSLRDGCDSVSWIQLA